MDSLEIKWDFYNTYGVEEYYLYDPDDRVLEGWLRQGGRLQRIQNISAWVSPRLGIRFEWQLDQELQIYRPDGERFLSPIELDQRAQQAEQRAERLAQQLWALGIDPDLK